MGQVQNDIEKTLNSLEGIQRAEAKPFLHTRAEARLEQHLKADKYRFVWKYATLFLVMLLINLATIYLYNSDKQKANSYNYMEVGQELNLDIDSYYVTSYIENEK